GSKLGQLPCARQGLVRVPESNTKYGGKGRKTGVSPRPVCCQVSVSPQGFPSEKNCLERANSGFAPAVHRQLFIAWEGLLRGDSREATGSPGWHARLPMAWGRDNRHGAPDSTGPTPLMTDSKPTRARAHIAPAGLMFLAITSVGWGFNWPVTKYLLSELPPLTMRGATGVIAYTMPVWASLLAWPILGERPNLLRVISLVMAFAGLAAIMGGNGFAASAAKLPGIIMALGGAFGFAVGTVLAKKLPLSLPPLTAAAWQIGIGCLP